MTVKAYSSIASHLVVEMNVSILAPTTYLCAQLLQPCYEKHDVEAFLLLIHTFGDLLSSNLLPVDLIASISWVSISVSSLPSLPHRFSATQTTPLCCAPPAAPSSPRCSTDTGSS